MYLMESVLKGLQGDDRFFYVKNEIILYRPNELAEHIEVIIDEDTVWLTQAQMVLLFGRDQSVISKHIRNIFVEGELDKKSVYAKFAYTATDRMIPACSPACLVMS